MKVEFPQCLKTLKRLLKSAEQSKLALFVPKWIIILLMEAGVIAACPGAHCGCLGLRHQENSGRPGESLLGHVWRKPGALYWVLSTWGWINALGACCSEEAATLQAAGVFAEEPDPGWGVGDNGASDSRDGGCVDPQMLFTPAGKRPGILLPWSGANQALGLSSHLQPVICKLGRGVFRTRDSRVRRRQLSRLDGEVSGIMIYNEDR